MSTEESNTENVADSASDFTNANEKADSQECVQEESDSPKTFSRWLLSLFVTVITWTFWVIWFILTVAVFLYGALILGLMYSTRVKMEMIFMNRVATPFFANLSDPQSFGLVKCEQLFLDGNAGKIGAWFVSPSSKQYIKKGAYIIYLHGNGGTRADKHRVEFVKRLSKMGYHVLTIDYRGYGDSDGWPTGKRMFFNSFRFIPLKKGRLGQRRISALKYVWNEQHW